eukprot:TRINITY_DN93174_c0_g1_i1.p1 TRINITY_DN93174_c0_g1~~TRINITY_DN93174_c0_g1_i1.p1  ORF type:complete len:525 (-),score=54.52 TRINITY_DN93174_c0_g1_i1:260-1834(-)
MQGVSLLTRHARSSPPLRQLHVGLCRHRQGYAAGVAGPWHPGRCRPGLRILSSSTASASTGSQIDVRLVGQVAAGLGSFLAFDAVVKVAMQTTGVAVYLPTQIGCMVASFGGLAAASLVAPGATAALHAGLMPAVSWVGRWLPVFLVPVQVMLPTISFPGGFAEGAKFVAMLGGGWLASLVVTSRLVGAGQALLPGLAKSVEAASSAAPVFKALAPLTMRLAGFWLLAAAALFPVGAFDMLSDGSSTEEPGKDVSRFVRGASFVSLGIGTYCAAICNGIAGHIAFLVCGVSCIGGVAAMAAVRGESFKSVVTRDYLTGNAEDRNFGDLSLWFLGPALVSTGVQIFQYRARIQALGPLLLASCATMSLVNILATVAIGPALGLSPESSLAATLRCVTVPIAVPTYGALLESDGHAAGNIALVALSAGVSGFLGFGFSKAVLASALCRAPLTQPVARGIATGTSGHVLASATFAGSEPEAFAWGMLAMAVAGVCSSAWICACPPVRDGVLRLARRNDEEDGVAKDS